MTLAATFVAAVAIPVCVACSWEVSTASSPASFDATARPLTSDPTVIRAVASSATVTLLGDMARSAYVKRSPIAAAALSSSTVRQLISREVQSEFLSLAKDAVVHREVVALIPAVQVDLFHLVRSPSSTDVSNVTVEVTPLITGIERSGAVQAIVSTLHLEQALAGMSHLRVTVIDRQQAIKLRETYRIAQVWWWLSAVIAAACGGVALALSRRRLSTLRDLSSAAAVTCLLATVLLWTGHPFATDFGSMSGPLARTVFSTVTSPLRWDLIDVAAVLALVAVLVDVVRRGTEARRQVSASVDDERHTVVAVAPRVDEGTLDGRDVVKGGAATP